MEGRLWYTEIEVSIGILTLVQSNRGLCLIEFGSSEACRSAIEAWMKKWGYTQLDREDAFFTKAADQLELYFAGQLTGFDLPLDMKGTPFQTRVWQVLQHIPYGETRSYKDVAVQCGQPKAARAVGMANNRNPLSIVIPCHRVIGASGQLVGYGGGISIKQALLGLERRTRYLKDQVI